MQLELYDSRIEKYNFFGNLYRQGKEFYYDPFSDILYSDVNGTLTEDDQHLGFSLLKHLGEDIFKGAKRIWKSHIPKMIK